MAGQAKRASELKQVAALVADAARGRSDYRPTILNAAMADAFDAAMASIGSDLRCWRGSKAEAEQRGHVCQRAKGHSGPHYAEVRAQAVRS